MSTKLKSAITDALKTSVMAVVKADNSRVKAGATVIAKTEGIITVAIEIGTLASWDLYRAELDRLARINKTAAKSLGYEEIEIERKGTKTLHTVPRQTLKNIFSTIRQSLKHSVELSDRKGAPRSYGAIMADKTKAVAKHKKSTATDRDKDMQKLNDIFKACITNAKVLSDADLNAVVARLAVEMPKTFPAASKAA